MAADDREARPPGRAAGSETTLRAFVRAASGTLALLTAIWSFGIDVFGGFSFSAFGLLIRSHDPLRPLVLCGLSIAVFFFTGGRTTLLRLIDDLRPSATAGWGSTLDAWRAGYVQNAIAGVVTISLLVVGVVNGSTAAGGADSFGYLSQAELWREGRLAIPQPWVGQVPWPNALWSFSPLGYTPARPARFSLGGFKPEQDRWSIVPVYSPGMPMLMAVTKAIGGVCGPFWVVPISGAVLVLSTYLIGIRLGSRTLGLLAMLLVATSPPFLLMHFVNMTDVPVAGALALACWCVLGTTMRSAAGGAVAFAAALLIRPNLVPLVPVVLVWLAWRIAVARDHRKREAWRSALIVAGIAGASIGTSAIYWFAYGSPFESGYGATAPYFSTSNIAPNIRNYVQWFNEVHTPLGFIGLVALALPIKRLWPDVTDRAAVAAFGAMTAVVIAEFLAYLVLDNSSYLRFFLVCYPFIMLGLASVSLAAARVPGIAGPLIATAVIGVVLVQGVRTSLEWRVFGQGLVEAKYADVADHVRRATTENSVVLSMQHSGSLRYFAGRVTLRWDVLPEDWLDRAVDWMAEHGVHTYALLDDFEQVAAVKRFAGQRLAATLNGPPLFRFGNKRFFDLGLPQGTPVHTEELPVIDLPPRCSAPAPPPGLVWK